MKQYETVWTHKTDNCSNCIHNNGCNRKRFCTITNEEMWNHQTCQNWEKK